MIRTPALPFAVIGLAALTLGTAAVSYRLGHDAGRIETYRETDRVLGELRAAFDLGPDAPRVTSIAPQSRHITNGDVP